MRQQQHQELTSGAAAAMCHLQLHNYVVWTWGAVRAGFLRVGVPLGMLWVPGSSRTTGKLLLPLCCVV